MDFKDGDRVVGYRTVPAGAKFGTCRAPAVYECRNGRAVLVNAAPDGWVHQKSGGRVPRGRWTEAAAEAAAEAVAERLGLPCIGHCFHGRVLRAGGVA